MREKVKDRLKEAAIVFSSPEQMKQLYLNTNWAESFKIVFPVIFQLYSKNFSIKIVSTKICTYRRRG